MRASLCSQVSVNPHRPLSPIFKMTRKLQILVSTLVFCGVSLAQGGGPEGCRPCVPEGDSVELEFPRPGLDSPGVPVNALWKNGDGSPEAWEKDGVSGNDDMGDATYGAASGSGTVTLTNDNGSIEGPNGVDVEFLDGCVEVYMVWYYRYSAVTTVCIKASVEIGGAGVAGSECIEMPVHREGWIRPEYREPVVVCPC